VKKSTKIIIQSVKVMVIMSLLLFHLPVLALAKEQTAGKTLNKKEVEAFIKKYYAEKEEENEVYGELSISVVKDDDVLFQTGFEKQTSKDAGEYSPEETSFYLGSIGKTVTAIAVMQLVESGKIDLEKDINTYLKVFKIDNPFDRKVTMNDLLSYSAGFEEPNPPENVRKKKEQLSLGEFLQKYQSQLVREPGTSIMYDNYAYNLAGYIIEQVTGMSFNDYVTENIFSPLEMNHSSFRVTSKTLKNMAKGFNSADQPAPVIYTVPKDMPGGGLVSTNNDMVNFMKMLLNKGTFGEQQIITEDSFKQIVTEHFPMTGYGIDIMHYKNEKVFRKGGDIPPFHSVLWLLPDHNIGINIIASSGAINFSDFLTKFIDHFINNSKETLANNDNSVSMIPTPKKELLKLEGTYQYIRQSGSTYRKILSFFQAHSQMEVNIIDKGKLKIHFMGKQREFIQMKELVFKEHGNETLGNHNQLTFFKGKGGNLYLQMPEDSTFFKKVSVLEKLSIHKWMFFGFVVIFLSMSIYLFISSRKTGKQNIQRLAFWNCISYFIFLPILLVTAFKVIGGSSQKLMYIPLSIPLIAAFLTAILITSLVRTWSTNNTGSKIVYSFIISISILYIILLNYWNLIF
jgi:CubicO group peptidase (beta-lactamase class C family)